MMVLAAILHAVFLVLVVAGVLVACRYIGRVSPVLSTIVWTGVILRLLAGLGLFAASTLDFGLFRGMHTGDGFWSLALDARVYYALAARAADNGLLTVEPGSPSPSFVLALAVWFKALGTHPISALMFNVVCYVITCVAVAFALRERSAHPASEQEWTLAGGTLIIASITFSPVLILTTTQILKDPFFAMLIVVGCVGAISTLHWLTRGAFDNPASLAAGVLIVMLGVCGAAGTRAYYPILFWLAYVTALAVTLLAIPRAQRLTAATVGLAVVCLIWLSFRVGSGAFYIAYENLVRSTFSSPTATTGGSGEDASLFSVAVPDVGEVVTHFRNEFIRSGGGTRLADAFSSGDLADIARDTLVGAAAMLVPMSLLQAMSIIDLQGGGRSLLVLITDLDTIFLDSMLLAGAIFLVGHRGTLRHDAASLVFLLVLTLLVFLLLAYVVTNFGTLFRLRLLAMVPAWLLPLAVVGRVPEHRSKLIA